MQTFSIESSRDPQVYYRALAGGTRRRRTPKMVVEIPREIGRVAREAEGELAIPGIIPAGALVAAFRGVTERASRRLAEARRRLAA
jgi:hypothetical protein